MSSIATLFYIIHGALTVPWGAIRATGKPPNSDPIHCGTAKWILSREAFSFCSLKTSLCDQLTDLIDL